MIYAFSISVNQTEYREVVGIKIHGHPAKYRFCGAYSFCVTGIADIANRWMNANNPHERDMAYVFEGEADRAFQMIK